MLNSFFIAGFPGTTRVPRNGRRVEQAETCGHQRFYAQDYVRARKLGLQVARESAQWPAIERVAGHYDFSFVRRRIHCARAQGVQLIWTLLDGGWPADLDVMRPAFVQRFAAYARAFARLLRDQEVKDPVVVPINEIGPLARAGGELAHVFPFLEERGLELRCQLLRRLVSDSSEVRGQVVVPIYDEMPDPASSSAQRWRRSMRCARSFRKSASCTSNPCLMSRRIHSIRRTVMRPNRCAANSSPCSTC